MPLQKRDPALQRAKLIIQNAFDEFCQVAAVGDASSFDSTTLADVKEAALKIEMQLAAKQSLRNMKRLMPLFDGLAHYAKTIEVLCNGTPFLPWLWAPVKFILHVSWSLVVNLFTPNSLSPV